MEGVPASRDYKGGFRCEDMAEVLAAALSSQQNAGSPMPMTKRALELYKQVLMLIMAAPCIQCSCLIPTSPGCIAACRSVYLQS